MIGWIVAALIAPQGVSEPTFPETQPAAAVRLWAGDAPGARGESADDVPTLTPYLPAAPVAVRTAVVVFPGGGYGQLAPHEGVGYARWLCGHGVAAFVVRYRLGRHGYRHPAMLEDAARAVRTVRARAGEWGVDPEAIGVMGSSAGGHLASTILTHWDRGDAGSDDPVERASSRPDFGILCYPVIGLGDELAHVGSRRNLLGDDPAPELVALLSNERHVTADTPPTFLWHTADDAVVSVRNSYAFAGALARAGVAHELHVYPHGRHGLGLGVGDPAGRRADELLPWTRACAGWLAEVTVGRAVADGVPPEVLQRAARWNAELPRDPGGAGAAHAAIGPVVARIGHVVVAGTADDALGRVEDAVRGGVVIRDRGRTVGRGAVVERVESYLIIRLSDGARAIAPGPGVFAATLER